MSKVLIVEDDPMIAHGLSSDLLDLGYDVIGTVSGEKELFKSIENEFPDVVIMDIELQGEKDGVQLAKELNNIQPTGIVYLSSKDDNRLFNRIEKQFKAIFLSKPISSPRQLSVNVQMAYEDVLQRRKLSKDHTQRNILFIHSSDGVKTNIDKSLIQYLEADGAYTNIHMRNGKCHKVSKNMKTVLSVLPDSFIQVHKSYVVNLEEVETIENKEPVMKGTKVVVRTSRTYRENLKQRTTFI